MWGAGGEGFGGGLIQRKRCTRTPDTGSGHTPPRGKAKGAGGLDPKSMEALIKYVIGKGKHGTGKLK